MTRTTRALLQPAAAAAGPGADRTDRAGRAGGRMMPATHARWWSREDWLAVWLGGTVLLAIVLAGGPALPSLRWGGAIAWTAPFGLAVLGPWAVLGVTAWALSALGVVVQGGRLLRYSAGFAVVFVLAWLAMLLAANVTATAWGLEYVVFALLLGLAVSHTTGTPERRLPGHRVFRAACRSTVVPCVLPRARRSSSYPGRKASRGSWRWRRADRETIRARADESPRVRTPSAWNASGPCARRR